MENDDIETYMLVGKSDLNTTYANDINEMLQAFDQSLVPYDETIKKAEKNLETVNAEIKAIEERMEVLTQQSLGLMDVIDEAIAIKEQISDAHTAALEDRSREFLNAIGKTKNIPAVLDLSRKWNIDCLYYHLYGHIYIVERPVDEITPPVGDTDSGLTSWMDNVNKED